MSGDRPRLFLTKVLVTVFRSRTPVIKRGYRLALYRKSRALRVVRRVRTWAVAFMAFGVTDRSGCRLRTVPFLLENFLLSPMITCSRPGIRLYILVTVVVKLVLENIRLSFGGRGTL